MSNNTLITKETTYSRIELLLDKDPIGGSEEVVEQHIGVTGHVKCEIIAAK